MEMEFKWFVILIAVICLCIMGLFFIESNPSMCKMEMGVSADINSSSDFVSNISINSISITAPCGEDLESLYKNSFAKFN